MSNSVFKVEMPVNEPILSYAPGSPDKAGLKKAIKELRDKEIEIPLIIGGKEIRTGNMGECRIPHEHGRTHWPWD